MTSVIRGSDNMDSAQVRPVLMAAQTASGTAVDFTGIPAWVQRVTVMFAGVSTSGTSAVQIQLGTSVGAETSGYVSTTSQLATTSTTVTDSTTGLLVTSTVAAASFRGSVCITKLAGNSYVSFGNIARPAITNTSAGEKSLAAVLDRIRITTVGGTDTFDAGTISVMYE